MSDTNATARAIEIDATSDVASKMDLFFQLAAGASFLASVSLWFLVNRDYGLFVGIWVPSILALWAVTRLQLLSKQID